jgi:hypothetical protein
MAPTLEGLLVYAKKYAGPDNKISAEFVDQALAEIGSPTASQQATAQALLSGEFQDKLEDDARKKLEKLVAAKVPSNPSKPSKLPSLPPPALTPDAPEGARFRGIPQGKLYVDGVSYKDPTQGAVGDCYFVSSLITIAHSNPALLSGAIEYLGKGDEGKDWYSVRFYNRKTGQPEYVKVTPEFPMDEDELVYAHSAMPREFWCPIIEKAYATWRAGYDKIEGGMPREAMFHLIGKDSEWLSTEADGRWSSLEKPREKLNDDALFQKLRKATQEKRPMAAGTRQGDDKVYEKAGLLAPHAYALLEAYESNGKRYVRLVEPNRQIEWGDDGVLDGDFVMPYEKFLEFFPEVWIIKP